MLSEPDQNKYNARSRNYINVAGVGKRNRREKITVDDQTDIFKGNPGWTIYNISFGLGLAAGMTGWLVL